MNEPARTAPAAASGGAPAPAASATVVCVLGMHRCGTSLTTRVLNLLGFDLGPEEDLLEPGSDNPSGYWEQEPVMRLNDAIFEALGGTWWRPPAMDPGWVDRPEVRALEPEARELIQRQFGGTRAWAWKDPRTSLTLPFWERLVEAPRYVVCMRSPNDVVDSLLRREPNTHSPESALALWLRYSAEALRQTEERPRLVVFYEDWFAAADDELDRLACFAGVDPAGVPSEARARIHAFVDADMRHHASTPAAVAGADALPAEARVLYLAARAASGPGSPRRTGAQGEAAAAGEALLRAAAELWPPFERRAADGAERARLEELVARLEGELDAATARAAELAARLEHSEHLLAQHRRWLEDLKSSVSWRLTKPLRAARRPFAR